ncbi:hypothetical protein S245_037004, partial [Arachis hypogaea]
SLIHSAITTKCDEHESNGFFNLFIVFILLNKASSSFFNTSKKNKKKKQLRFSKNGDSFLNLSSRGLTGHIAVYISKLTELKDLSNNSLIGEIPIFLVENPPSLRVLNLQNNNLTGLIPNALLQKSSEGVLSLRLGQNLNLCESGPCDQQTKDKSKENNPVIYILASVSTFLMLLLVVLAAVNIIYIKKRKLK